MGDEAAKSGENILNKAQIKTNGRWALFSSNSKYEDAADFCENSVKYFLKAEAWDRAAAAYIKLAGCHLKLERRHEAASAYAISCLEKAVNQFMKIRSFNMLCEAQQNVDQAIGYFERAADLFQSEEVMKMNCLKDNLLKYSVKRYLLSAGLCQLFKDGVLLTDLAAATDEEDVGKFTDAFKEFESMTRLD
ncbi:hypothetical protein MKW98_011620, partial [Papaver atlanticum]